MELTSVDEIDLCQKIGEGSFGLVRLGRMKLTNEEVAVKLEPRLGRKFLLRKEYDILMNLQGCPGVPRVFSYGIAGDYNFMAMQLLGNSLSHKLRVSGGKLGVPTVLRCADQMIETLEAVHSAGFLHRDIKPQNFLVGIRPNRDKVYLIDFGLARRGMELSFFRSASTEQGQLTGTLPYMSLNVHLGLQYSRRDDLESLMYVLVYLLKGSLPWHGEDTTSLKEKQVRSLKQSLDFTQLCESLPVEFEVMLRYARGLRIDDVPNYERLRKAVQSAMLKLGPEVEFDWGEERSRAPKRSKSHRNLPKLGREGSSKRMSCRHLPVDTGRTSSSIALDDSEGSPVLRREKTVEKLFQGFADKKVEILKRVPKREKRKSGDLESIAVVVEEGGRTQACCAF